MNKKHSNLINKTRPTIPSTDRQVQYWGPTRKSTDHWICSHLIRLCVKISWEIPCRRYLCLCTGPVLSGVGTISAALSNVMSETGMKSAWSELGKEARTDYEVLEVFPKFKESCQKELGWIGHESRWLTLNGWMIRRRNMGIKLLSRNCRREPCFCDSAILLRQVPQNLSNIGMMDWTATWGELLGRLRFSPEFLPMKLFHHEDWFSLDCEETSWMDLWNTPTKKW